MTDRKKVLDHSLFQFLVCLAMVCFLSRVHFSLFAFVFLLPIANSARKSKKRPETLPGHATIYESSKTHLYGKRVGKRQLDLKFESHEIPLGWVKKGVSKKSLLALQKFVKFAEQHQMLLLYPNWAGKPEGQHSVGEEGDQVANGMSGDRAKTDLQFTTTFNKDGDPKVHLEWPSPSQYMWENEYNMKNGFHKTEVTDIKRQYEYLYSTPSVKKAFEEIVTAEVRDIIRRDESYKQKFEDQTAQFYFNIIQYFGDYHTLPDPLQKQIQRYSEQGLLSLEKILETSEQRWSNGGGWHSDGVDLILRRNDNFEHTMQSLLVIDSSGIVRGGGTALRNEPADWKVPFSKLKDHEKLALRIKGPDGAIATFSQLSRNPLTGENIKTSHMAEPYQMRLGGSRTALSLFVYFDEKKSSLPDSLTGSNQGPQEDRSLVLPR